MDKIDSITIKILVGIFGVLGTMVLLLGLIALVKWLFLYIIK